MKHTFLMLALFSCFVFAQCKKDKNSPEPDNPYGLPNATREGKNILACRVNGVNWISAKGIYDIGGLASNDSLSAWGNLKNADHVNGLSVYIWEGAAQGGSYPLSENGNNRIRQDLNKTCNGDLGSNILQLFAVSGTVTINRFDKINKIISGTFNCKIPVPTCDTLNITDGRFDIRYY